RGSRVLGASGPQSRVLGASVKGFQGSRGLSEGLQFQNSVSVYRSSLLLCSPRLQAELL
ncbi:hypothetical protein J4Q44_G00182910, partial [Coregonus suidteri]